MTDSCPIGTPSHQEHDTAIQNLLDFKRTVGTAARTLAERIVTLQTENLALSVRNASLQSKLDHVRQRIEAHLRKAHSK